MSSCWISMCLFLFSYAVSEQRQMSVRALDYSYFLHAECFPLWICLSIHPSFYNSMLIPSEYFGATMNCNTYPLHAKHKFLLYISVAVKINVLYWHVHYIPSILRHTIALCKKQIKVMLFFFWKYSAACWCHEILFGFMTRFIFVYKNCAMTHYARSLVVQSMGTVNFI